MKKLIYLGIAASLMFTACKDNEETPENEGCTTSFETSYLYGDDTTKFITIADCGEGTGTYTMTKDIVYILDGLVFVNEGQTLTIEAGTIIKGKSGQGENASALVVAMGGKIDAQGTASMPIIMTAEADGTNRTTKGTLVGSDDLGLTVSGQWGGLIVLGKAGLNSNPGTSSIEGISASESRGQYGGTDDADNSGTIKYLSVRHGGTNIGADNEINGITLGGVGSGTTIEYVEVVANADDGIEFFGGTAQVKYALVSNCGDDSFDYDEGFRGKGQYWVSISPGDRNGEHDGGTDPETAEPYATPTIYNASYIGGKKITFRDNAGGYYMNSIFESFTSEPAIDIEDLDAGVDSKTQHDANRLQIKDNLFSNSGDLLVTYSSDKTTSIADASNTTSESVITATNPVPTTAISGTTPSDNFFDATTYKGAFDDSNWATGWTLTFPSAQ